MTELKTKIEELEEELSKLIDSLEPQDQRGINVKHQMREKFAAFFGDLYWWVK